MQILSVPNIIVSPLSGANVSWNKTASFEQKPEPIMKKWIALFPEGTVVWAEFPQTGYPKLYRILIPKNLKLTLGTFIERLIYSVLMANQVRPHSMQQS